LKEVSQWTLPSDVEVKNHLPLQLPFLCYLLERVQIWQGCRGYVVNIWFFHFWLWLLFSSFLPLESYLKIFGWEQKDIIYENMYSKLAKIACHRLCWPSKKVSKNWFILLQMLIKWLKINIFKSFLWYLDTLKSIDTDINGKRNLIKHKQHTFVCLLQNTASTTVWGQYPTIGATFDHRWARLLKQQM
jgi:hypothetical protein